MAHSRFLPSGGFTSEGLNSSVVISTGVCDRCRVVSCSFSGSDIFQNGLGQPLLQPLILWLALASDSFVSKVFPISFLGLISDMVALWDESVAIGVQIEVFYPTGSTECFLSIVCSVVWRSVAFGSRGSSPEPFPTAPLLGELGLYR